MTRAVLGLLRGLLLALPATVAHADIYACPGPRDMTTYQNFPCQFTSLGSMSTAALQGSASSSTSAAELTHASAARSAATSAAPGQHLMQATSGAAEPGPGMSESDVRKVWGEPDEIIQDEPPSGRVDIWHYNDGRTVLIRKHRVVTG